MGIPKEYNNKDYQKIVKSTLPASLMLLVSKAQEALQECVGEFHQKLKSHHKSYKIFKMLTSDRPLGPSPDIGAQVPTKAVDGHL